MSARWVIEYRDGDLVEAVYTEGTKADALQAAQVHEHTVPRWADAARQGRRTIRRQQPWE